MPVVISGAVTMKMISSTSITSMNGTMLISFIERRRRVPSGDDGGHGRSAERHGSRAVAGASWPPAALALRCRMLENSSMKVSSWMAMRSMSRAKRL